MAAPTGQDEHVGFAEPEFPRALPVIGFERLRDPGVRETVAAEMVADQDDWENLMLAAGAEGTLLVGFRNPELRHYIGRTLADVADERSTSVQETAMEVFRQVVSDRKLRQIVSSEAQPAELYQFERGQEVEYWRESGKSQPKRGGRPGRWH